jgi:type IV fimbrial biogenesis protein FimT
MDSKTIRKSAGFTLIELLITVALFTIIVSSVAPSVSNFYTRNKVAAIVNNHSAAIQLARHTAVTQSVFVVVCPTKDMSTCDTDWNQVKMVFVDENSDGVLNGTEEVIGSADMVSGYSMSSTRNSLRFAPFNTAQNLTATISICPKSDSSAFARALIISNVGRVRIEKDSDNINCSS